MDDGPQATLATATPRRGPPRPRRARHRAPGSGALRHRADAGEQHPAAARVEGGRLMGDRSKIEWTRGDDGRPGATWNPIRRRWRPDRAAGHACLKISPGCDHCYAGKLQAHYYGGADYPAVSRESLAGMAAAVDHGALYLDPVALTQPLRWKRPRRIFVGSMTDLFGEWVPDAWLDAIWGVMLLAPQHTFQVLTKRPHRMAAYLSDP